MKKSFWYKIIISLSSLKIDISETKGIFAKMGFAI
jgi:hypothetical protein